jgi:3'-phosphoadenosine 5'-phosphosulfate sulfotransferase (PAPS reductase)/FAD synthetase
MVRFRTVGDITCTAPVESDADSVARIIAETAITTITERGATRLDDQTSATPPWNNARRKDISDVRDRKTSQPPPSPTMACCAF